MMFIYSIQYMFFAFKQNVLITVNNLRNCPETNKYEPFIKDQIP